MRKQSTNSPIRHRQFFHIFVIWCKIIYILTDKSSVFWQFASDTNQMTGTQHKLYLTSNWVTTNHSPWELCLTILHFPDFYIPALAHLAMKRLLHPLLWLSSLMFTLLVAAIQVSGSNNYFWYALACEWSLLQLLLKFTFSTLTLHIYPILWAHELNSLTTIWHCYLCTNKIWLISFAEAAGQSVPCAEVRYGAC